MPLEMEAVLAACYRPGDGDAIKAIPQMPLVDVHVPGQMTRTSLWAAF